MLTDSFVLDYIKSSLGSPFTEIELADEEILKRVKKFTLRSFFSQYVPAYKFRLIDTSDNNTRVDNNTFIILDEDNAGILSVFDVITQNELIKSLNILGSMGLEYADLPSWYAAQQARSTGYLTTNWYQIFEFRHPNYISVRPSNTIPSNILVCYEAQHARFETIPTYREAEFLDLALAGIQKNIGVIRSKYPQIETQFGPINLNWETIKSDGTELWNTTMEALKKIPPRVILDIG